MKNNNTNQLLSELFNRFQAGIRATKSVAPKEYLKRIGLDFQFLQIGFNSGQFHHRKSDKFKQKYAEIGILNVSSALVREKGMAWYSCFGTYGIIFPLKNINDEIVNFFAVRFKLQSRLEEYLNEEGIYPGYPHTLTKRLFIAPTIVEAATLIQAKVLDNKEAVMALYGGEIKAQHYKAIKELKGLEEIIVIQSK